MSNIRLTPNELQLWRKFIHELTGISLDDKKEYLIQERLGNLLSETGSSSFSQLYFHARNPENQPIRDQVIDALTTNETSFFRDGFPFETLQTTVFPGIIKRLRSNSSRNNTLRVWSAGCSTGQELFSIAMILAELNVEAQNINIELLGTDISKLVLSKAQNALFTRFEIERGLSKERRERFFTQRGPDWKLVDSLVKKVSFRELNLVQPFTFPEKMDLIFCRNVAIYFLPEEKRKLFSKIARVLDDNGFLSIGTTENMCSPSSLFREVRFGQTVLYQTLKKTALAQPLPNPSPGVSQTTGKV